MGPVHGAIVNWCGHKYGYQNYDNGDVSRNTLAFDFLTGGELFQNNHHKFAMSPNFAARKFELDPTYPVIRVLAALGIIDTTGAQKIRYPAERVPSSRAPA
jgi:stearoyl-CoA desaturase (delta-9 desaturase)